MNTIVPRSLWIAPLATLVLFGAGCFQSEPAPVTPPTVPASPTAPAAPATPTTPNPTPTQTPTENPTETPAETPIAPNTSPSTPSGYKLPEIDASWRTYTNRAETYSYMYPTKGKYAPTWSAKIVAANDVSYKDGCYFYNQEPNPGRLGTGPRKVTLGGIEFCHLALGDASAGHLGLVDTYTTMVGGQIISIVFEKMTTNPGMCPEHPVCAQALKEETYVLSVGEGYSMFYGTEYASHLDQIMSTFKKLK